jgi:hypothetical protein
MGFAPPPDAPPPGPPGVITADVGLAAGPPVATICGFPIPDILPRLKFGLNIPGIDALFNLPSLHIGLGINCSTSNPFDITAGVSPGGGRVGSSAPDPDIAASAGYGGVSPT